MWNDKFTRFMMTLAYWWLLLGCPLILATVPFMPKHRQWPTTVLCMSMFLCALVLGHPKSWSIKILAQYPKKCIYLLLRSDGVLKLGRTIDLNRRLKALQRDYRKQFSVLYAWPVSDLYTAEYVALSCTSDFEYVEGTRKELRKGSIPDIIERVTVAFHKEGVR